MEIKNIYGETYLEKHIKFREGCRGIVICDDKVLLSYEETTDFWSTPGGGLEQEETLEECLIREIEEETGFIVKPLEHYLIINEYYDEWKYVNNFFTCEITGQGKVHLTETEKDLPRLRQVFFTSFSAAMLR